MGNLRKFKDFFKNLYLIKDCGDQLAYQKIFGSRHARIIFVNTLHSKFAIFHKKLLYEKFSRHTHNDY